MIKRLDTLEVAATHLEEAAALYQRNFGFSVKRAEGSDEAIIAVGDAQIRLRSGAQAEAALKATGEGLAALWLEADDVEPIAAALDRAGLAHRPIRCEGDQRVLEVDPPAANMVPLFIFDRHP
ncbi:MAG TPA: VOC family protein [Candidatus Binataceae bacterium]|nr:VOC family protein [Candidatus Binataceae bacterium]